MIIVPWLLYVTLIGIVIYYILPLFGLSVRKGGINFTDGSQLGMMEDD